MKSIKSQQEYFKDQARKWEERAEESSTRSLREYYQGRADGARSAASGLSKFAYEEQKDPDHSQT